MRFHVSVILSICLFAVGMISADEARLLRFPDLSSDYVAFVYAGDVYTVSRSGGTALRLTSHEGLELFPKFSPNGSHIALTGQYHGDQAVYVLPMAGGVPVRLTWHPGFQNQSERMGSENIVIDWTADGKSVIFRSRKEKQDVWDGRIYTVSIDGGLPEPLPMHTAGFTSLSPDGSKVAYCPIFRDFRTWKRYQGGMAQDVWIYDLANDSSVKITDWVGTDNMPMWYADKIYFNSDQTGSLNLYCYDIPSGQTRQVTQYTDYDVRWPSLGPDGIVFEKGGYLYVMDLPSEEITRLTVNLVTDHHTMVPQFIDASEEIGDYVLAPDGKRVLFSARGDIFSLPAEEGITYNLTASSGAHDKEPVWSPDGQHVAFISDASGEDEVYLCAPDGSHRIQLTTGGECRKYGLWWSPDSRKIAFSDKNLILYTVNVVDKSIQILDEDDFSEFRDIEWSPDSRYLTYTKSLPNRMSGVFIFDTHTDTAYQVTEGLANDYSPVFDPDGKYLYFFSEREFNPLFSRYEFEFVNRAITSIYMILLDEDTESPFAPENDMVMSDDDDDDDNNAEDDSDKKNDRDGKDRDKKSSGVTVTIDFDGIFDRQVGIDIPTGDYSGLQAISGAIFYRSDPLRGTRGRISTEASILHKYDIDEEADHDFATNAGGYRISFDGKKMLLRKGGSWHISSTRGSEASFKDNTINTSDLKVKVDKRAEYRQMFEEAWRLQRDFFYDENTHGVDWKAMYDKYAVLLPHVNHRFDLTYVIGEMIGELCCSHTYVGGGDYPELPSSNIGLLGVNFEVDRENNRIKIARILRGENWDQALFSPLFDPDIEVNEGDYLLAIDGHEITAGTNPYSLTEQKAGKLVTLTVNDQPSMKNARKVMVKLIGSEGPLRYHNWVEDNRRVVDSISKGEIGYLHIPDMGGYGLMRFVKMFYHQQRRNGLIIDVRYNGGGFVSHLVLDRLREKLLGVGVARNSDIYPVPGDAVNAHLITLCNEFSCSDGDIFPYHFRQYELGPLMGMRTWGGVVGIRGFRPLIDGGYVTVPEYSRYSLDREWVMENEGVTPDIEVVNRPEREAAGYDDQLMQALEYIQNKLQIDPKTLPAYPGPPEER